MRPKSALPNLLGGNAVGYHTRRMQESDPEGPLPMRQRRRSFAVRPALAPALYRERCLACKAACRERPSGRTTVGNATMNDTQTLTVPAGSLPYLLQCDRCIQRRLHLKHTPPPWMTQGDRHQRRRQTIKDIRQRELGTLGPGFPAGTLCKKGKALRSVPISVPGHTRLVVLTGRIDLFALVDGQVNAIVYVDPPPPRPDQLQFRQPQLHGWSFALRNPANTTTALRSHPNLQAGILSCRPNTAVLSESSVPWLSPTPQWLKCGWSDANLLGALRSVLDVYERGTGTPFAPGLECSWCKQEKL